MTRMHALNSYWRVTSAIYSSFYDSRFNRMLMHNTILVLKFLDT